MSRGNRWGLIGALLIFAAASLLYGLLASPAIRAEDGKSQQGSAGDKPGGGPPPLVIKKEAPLLLLDESKSAKAKDKPGADNESCFVCHGNYREEPLVQWHAKEDIGCMKCHGSSAAHRDDEDNVTPPDIIYPSDKIDAMCQKCHAEHNAPARKVISTWKKKCPDKSDPSSIVCTDCHGAHRLASRTVRWDKNTRKLIKQKPADKPEAIDKM